MPVFDVIALIITGLFAGVLGGLLGIGGSIIMIPVLSLLLHKHQQLSQASAMIVNIFVAVPAMFQHHRADAVRWDIMRRALPAALVFILVGVEASNRISGELLMKLFGAFLIYVIYTNVRKLFDRPTPAGAGPPPPLENPWLGAAITGSITGLFAGLLGIGGGIIAVPLLQKLCRLPLRQCIATSSALMCVTAIIGAIRKNMTLESLTDAAGAPLGLTIEQSLLIAACLAPTAVIGALIGAKLTHALQVNIVRFVLIVLLAIACVQMLW